MSKLCTNIYRFLDYPRWLKAEYEARRAVDPGFTHRRFSELCGYKSSGALSLLISCKRNLSREALERIATALGMDSGERVHFRRMLDYEQADDFAARAAVLDRMKAARRFAEEWADRLDAVDYYRDWHVPVVRELVALDDFVEEPAWMSARMHHRVGADACALAIDRLLAIGMLERDDEGRLRQTDAILSTPPEVRSEALKEFQRQMMWLAGEALDTQASERRDMRVVTMAISRQQASDLKTLLGQLQKEALDIVSRDEPIEAVYQLNTQLFELTQPKEPGS